MNKEEILNTFLLANIPEIITQEEFNDVKRAIKQLLQENQELKSQLAGTTHCFDEEEHRKLKDEIKKLERIIELCHLDAKETLATINFEQENQQKEFIEYLEKTIIDSKAGSGQQYYYQQVLEMYKEIIGDDK